MPSTNPRANLGNKDVGVGTDIPPGATHDVIPFNPYDDPVHPSNWPAWKRHAQLVTLAWIAFLANYSAGCHLVVSGQVPRQQVQNELATRMYAHPPAN